MFGVMLNMSLRHIVFCCLVSSDQRTVLDVWWFIQMQLCKPKSCKTYWLLFSSLSCHKPNMYSSMLSERFQNELFGFGYLFKFSVRPCVHFAETSTPGKIGSCLKTFHCGIISVE
ncbi:hypothetical protein XENORESO_014738 [Xenotaenia resolanae]|uniref:Secreted protein n=1 Tax=Xenotaenia resolanae TaxID=208358 RepID=A0ABV0X191_9TELE